MRGIAICDGRGNAGTGACAAVLIARDDVHERAEKIEATTNIVAEHLSIQLAIALAYEVGVTDLLVLNDSQTPVFQIQGKYKTKLPHLKNIVDETLALADHFSTFEIIWVPREITEVADKLCREIDPKRSNARRKRPGGPLPSKSEKRQNPFFRTPAGREEYRASEPS